MKHSISTNQSPIGIRAILSPCSTRGRKGTGLFNQVFKGFVPMRSRVKHGNGVGFLFFLFFAFSCTEAEVADELRPAPGQEVDASFNLQVLASQTTQTRSITFTAEGAIESDSLGVDTAAPDAVIPAAPDSLQTKSTTPLSEVLEYKLSTLWVGQYDATTGAHMFSQYFTTFSGTTVNIKLKANETGHTSRVYFVANTSNLGEVADTTTLKNKTLQFNSTAEGLPGNNLCMMMGQWNGEVPPTGMSNIEVKLRRLVAKISFTYAISGANFSFTLDSVSLKNAPILSQVAAPTTQLTGAGMSYKDYTDKNLASTSKTFYWYLPENMAGTVTGSNAVASEKLKIGTGVTNATCIELAGSAVQDGVSYNDVVIRFFPGANMNNYDIVRNAHYQMNVTLVGLDVSDKRITVGEVPSVVVDPSKMLAEKGSEKTVQIPARPGVPWELELPAWLSALVDNTTAPAGSTIKYDGPVLVTLQAAEANPKAEDRTETVKLSIDNTSNNFQLTQAGSKLTLNNNISLDVTGKTESSATFTATQGLPWKAIPSAGWIVFTADNEATEGDATGTLQTLKVKADGVNQYAESREGRIILKAGVSITDDTYAGLKKEIAVVQMGSKVTDCSVLNNVAPEGAPNQTGSFIATQGLDWRLSVATADSWLHVKGANSGTPTTGTAQTVTFDVDVNPNSTLRNGGITVEAGLPSFGPKGKIVVSQLGSTFELVSPITSTVELGFESQDFNATIKGTKGLKWEVNPHDAAKQIAPIAFNGDVTGQEQNIAFAARENIGPPRSETFNITVPGGDHKKTITVRQKANPILTINQEVLTNYVKKIGTNLSSYPPFDIDNDGGSGIKSKHHGVEFTIDGANSTMTGYYQLQVESTQKSNYDTYLNMQNYCKNLREGGFTDWRLPTQIELYIMWDKAKGTNANAGDNEPDSKIYGAPFIAGYYWSSSVSNGNTGLRCLLTFNGGGFSVNYTSFTKYVRCVRDLN